MSNFCYYAMLVGITAIIWWAMATIFLQGYENYVSAVGITGIVCILTGFIKLILGWSYIAG